MGGGGRRSKPGATRAQRQEHAAADLSSVSQARIIVAHQSDSSPIRLLAVRLCGLAFDNPLILLAFIARQRKACRPARIALDALFGFGLDAGISGARQLVGQPQGCMLSRHPSPAREPSRCALARCPAARFRGRLSRALARGVGRQGASILWTPLATTVPARSGRRGGLDVWRRPQPCAAGSAKPHGSAPINAPYFIQAPDLARFSRPSNTERGFGNAACGSALPDKPMKTLIYLSLVTG